MAPNEGDEVVRASVEHKAPGFQLREVEDLVDKPQQSLPVALHHRELLADVRFERAVRLRDEPFQGSDDERERRTELVADVRKKAAFRLIERTKLPGLVLDPRVLRLERVRHFLRRTHRSFGLTPSLREHDEGMILSVFDQPHEDIDPGRETQVQQDRDRDLQVPGQKVGKRHAVALKDE